MNCYLSKNHHILVSNVSSLIGAVLNVVQGLFLNEKVFVSFGKYKQKDRSCDGKELGLNVHHPISSL